MTNGQSGSAAEIHASRSAPILAPMDDDVRRQKIESLYASLPVEVLGAAQD